MSDISLPKILVGLLATLALSFALVLVLSSRSAADIPDPPIDAPFTAPTCAGDTFDNPTQNTSGLVLDLTQVFGERLTSYNAGSSVPLYDAFGGSILLNPNGDNTGEDAYPPLCATRYVESLDTAVSEWMYCTDRKSQTCGDTDSEGNLVDREGNPINPMTALSGNPRLTPDQEKLIAYLIQNGHPYEGVGSQAWGGATEARSDAGTNERTALQTLVWCISDPPSTGEEAGFVETCENNMDAAEQARLLQMIPDTPELVLALDSTDDVLDVDDSANFTLTTNVFNQPIELTTGGTADATWTVCAGDATLTGSALTVAGVDPTEVIEVTLCATAATAGTATLSMYATPPSTEHIGWAQSINDITPPCQVYATFHQVNLASVTASAAALFEAVDATAPGPEPAPGPGAGETDVPITAPEVPQAVETGITTGVSPLWWAAVFFGLGSAAAAALTCRARNN